MNYYTRHTVITKELLDSIQVGDQVKCNDWLYPRIVKAVSENFFVMARKAFGKIEYTVCDKRPWGVKEKYEPRKVMAYTNPEDFTYGWYYNGFDFDEDTNMQEYIDALESGKIGLYRREGFVLEYIAILKKEPERLEE